MKAKDEREGKGCLGRTPDDEMVFVLRAQDKLAAPLVELWATLAELFVCPSDKVAEARACAAAMRQWYINKLPD